MRAILFDLDGTLIDQFEPIHRAFKRTLVSMGFPPPSFSKVKSAVGGASHATMTKLIGPDNAEEGVRLLRPIFEEEMFHGLKALPGVINGLKLLNDHDFKCAVLTNKHGPHARAACKYLGLDKFITFTLGADDTEWKKPSPKLTQLALKKIGFTAQETLYVGDSPYDFNTAINAGLKCYLVASGTHSIEDLSLFPGVKVHDNFISLVSSLIGNP